MSKRNITQLLHGKTIAETHDAQNSDYCMYFSKICAFLLSNFVNSDSLSSYDNFNIME